MIPKEIKELPVLRGSFAEDGRRLELQGIIHGMLEQCDFDTVQHFGVEKLEEIHVKNPRALGQAITFGDKTSRKT